MSRGQAADEVVTYEDAARWLPLDVRRAIEVTAPCSDGGQHRWEHQQFDLQNLAEAVPRSIEHWGCQGCGLSVGQDPAKLP